MRSFFNRLTSNRYLAVLLLAINVLPFAVVVMEAPALLWWMWVVMVVQVIVIIGLIWYQAWAQKVAVVLLFCIAVSGVINGFMEGWNWRRIGKAVGYSFIAYGLWKRPEEGFFDVWEDEDEDGRNRGLRKGAKAKSGTDAEDEEPMISLVHLRSAVRYLEAVVLAEALSEAWGIRVTAGEDVEGSDGFVVGETPVFIVSVQRPVQAFFLIHNLEGEYFDNAEELAGKVPNLRFAQVIRDHVAWLSVDLMKLEGSLDQTDKAYQLIGKAVAALADDDTLGIFCPQYSTFNLWSEQLAETLGGDEPLSAFREEVKAPVISVRDTDAIEAAIAEARSRWPEFQQAFAQRDQENTEAPPYLVKAKFATGDETEHMWIQVFGLEPEYVHGHLLNDPYHHPKLKRGEQVEVSMADVSDWIFMRNDEPVGNFTGRVVAESSRGERG